MNITLGKAYTSGSVVVSAKLLLGVDTVLAWLSIHGSGMITVTASRLHKVVTKFTIEYTKHGKYDHI